MNNNQLRSCVRLILKATGNEQAIQYLTMSHDQWKKMSRVLPNETTDLRECVRWVASANTLENQDRVMEAKTDLEHAMVYARKIAEASGVDAFHIECRCAKG